MVIIRIARLCWRELRSLAADPRLLLILVATPVLYTVLFGCLYGTKRVTHIPTWVIDEDRSALSRTITVAAANDETLRVVHVGGTLEEFRQACVRGDAYACLVIPRDFSRDVKRGKSVRLLTVIEGGNMIIANSVTRAGAEIGGTYNVGVQMKRLSLRGTPSMYALPGAMPIESATRVWYNPAYNYMDFLLPGLIGTIVQQVTLLGVALAFAREREKRELVTVLRISRSPLELLVAKGVVYTALNLTMAALSYAIAVRVFGVEMHGAAGLFALLLAVFIVALV
ncbi:MAG TPA: ABC transporter permease, partial [Armatimonadota bacterium]